MLRLSIIIPVYNVEEYIGRCLKSVLNQDIPAEDYEIIVIDDGTPDSSLDIVAVYKERCHNIRVISRQNGGLSAARNTGLTEARGEYIWFIDSDDWIEPNCISRLLTFAEEKQLDVLCFNAKIYNSAEDIYDIPSSTVRTGELFAGPDFVTTVNTIPSACSAFYRRQFLICNNLTFYEGLLHEDQEFTPRAYALSKRISYIHENIYYYFQREGSIMKSSRNEKRCRDLLTVADSLYEFALTHFKDREDVLQTFIHKVNFAFTQSLAFYDKSYFPMKNYRQRAYYPLSTKGLSGSFRWKCHLANFSLALYLYTHKNLKNKV